MCRIFVFIETSQHADRCSLFVQQFRSTNKKGENDENKNKNKIKTIKHRYSAAFDEMENKA